METKSWEVGLFKVEMIGTAVLTLAFGFFLLIPDVFLPSKIFANFASSILFLFLIILWGPGLAFMIYKGIWDNWRSKGGLCKLEIYTCLAFFYFLLFFYALNIVFPSLETLTEKGNRLTLSVFLVISGTLFLILFYRVIKDRYKVRGSKEVKT